jgi:hypothetical protein
MPTYVLIFVLYIGSGTSASQYGPFNFDACKDVKNEILSNSWFNTFYKNGRLTLRCMPLRNDHKFEMKIGVDK